MQLFKKRDRSPGHLVLGLGNHGSVYKNNRHNVGFMVVDSLARTWGQDISKKKARAFITTHTYADELILMAKPRTFMNESGRAAQALLDSFKILPAEMIVIFDDLDLPLGAIRLRPSGGTGGHRGMRSIQNHIYTQEYPRMRIGIGRPPGRMDPAAFVLEDFSPPEVEILSATLDHAVECLLHYFQHGIEDAMNQCNAVQAP